MSSYLVVPVAPGTYYDDLTRGCIAEGERFTFKYPPCDGTALSDPFLSRRTPSGSLPLSANTSARDCGQDMVFAVNPEPDGTYNSFAAFKAKVLAIAIGE